MFIRLETNTMEHINRVMHGIIISDRNEYPKLEKFVSDTVMELCRDYGECQGDVTCKLTSEFDWDTVMSRLIALAAVQTDGNQPRCIFVVDPDDETIRVQVIQELRALLSSTEHLQKSGTCIESPLSDQGHIQVHTNKNCGKNTIRFIHPDCITNRTSMDAYVTPTHVFVWSTNAVNNRYLRNATRDALRVELC